MQPPMAPYAFHPGWAAPRKSVHDRITRPVRDRLSYGANRSSQSKNTQKVWLPKSPCAETLESGKPKDHNTNADSVMLGTQELKLKEPVVGKPANSSEPMLATDRKSVV